MKYTLTVLMFLPCHIRILELICTSWLPEYQGTPCSKQARYLKFRLLQSFSLSSASVKLASFCFWFRRKTTLWRRVYLIIRNSFRGFIHNQVSVGVQWLSKHLILSFVFQIYRSVDSLEKEDFRQWFFSDLLFHEPSNIPWFLLFYSLAEVLRVISES